MQKKVELKLWNPHTDASVRLPRSWAVSRQWNRKPGRSLPSFSVRPAVTFAATERHRPLVSTKLYRFVAEAQLWTSGVGMPHCRDRRKRNPQASVCKFDALLCLYGRDFSVCYVGISWKYNRE